MCQNFCCIRNIPQNEKFPPSEYWFHQLLTNCLTNSYMAIEPYDPAFMAKTHKTPIPYDLSLWPIWSTEMQTGLRYTSAMHLPAGGSVQTDLPPRFGSSRARLVVWAISIRRAVLSEWGLTHTMTYLHHLDRTTSSTWGRTWSFNFDKLMSMFEISTGFQHIRRKWFSVMYKVIMSSMILIKIIISI